MSERDDPSDLTPPAARTESIADGVEGRGARRERGLSEKRVGPFQNIGQFLHEVRLEMRRVTWPTRDEIKNTTVITLIAMISSTPKRYAAKKIIAIRVMTVVFLISSRVGHVTRRISRRTSCRNWPIL